VVIDIIKGKITPVEMAR